MESQENNAVFVKNAIEAAIKISILAVMVVATFSIIKPFIIPVVWGIILAVAAEPLIKKFETKRKMASTILALALIAALIVPSVMLISASVDTVQTISTQMENDTLVVPPPNPKVEEWPLIGTSVYKTWSLASSNLDAALKKYAPQIKSTVFKILGSAGSGLKGVFMSIVSIAIGAVLLATAKKGTATTVKIVSRFAGEKGPEIVALATATTRGVMQGVIGVAIIQSVLAAIGMVLVGVPLAGLWAVAVLILAVIQLPPILILGPIAVWVFSMTSTVPAVLFLIWAILVSGCDGVIKPILMGRGVDAPMLVILLGALGGMMLYGIIGLFVGAVVVATSYTLFMRWIDEEEVPTISSANKDV